MGYQGHQRGACGDPDWTKQETGLERLQDWIIKMKLTGELSPGVMVVTAAGGLVAMAPA